MSLFREVRALNLLLLLSALLSAMTGIGSARGQAAPASAVCACAAEACVASRTVRSVAHRPAMAIASIAETALPPLGRAWPLQAAEPLFATRRRE